MLSIGPRSAAGDTTRPQAPPRRRGRLRRCVLVLALGGLVIAAGFVWFVQRMPISEAPPARNADGIVVLTGAAARINDALTLLAEGHGQRLLITGVNPTTRSREISRMMPEYQRWFSCCVDLDHSATNTIGNAIETRRWVKARGFKSLIVVTSNFHMPRAMAELAHQLPGVELVPYPVVSDKVRVETWWTNGATVKLLFLEYVKYVVARTRVWVGVNLA